MSAVPAQSRSRASEETESGPCLVTEELSPDPHASDRNSDAHPRLMCTRVHAGLLLTAVQSGCGCGQDATSWLWALQEKSPLNEPADTTPFQWAHPHGAQASYSERQPGPLSAP